MSCLGHFMIHRLLDQGLISFGEVTGYEAVDSLVVAGS